MKKFKNIAALFLTVCFAALSFGTVSADESGSGAAKSKNIGTQTYSEYPFMNVIRSYGYDFGSYPMNSYLIGNEDGTLTRVEYCTNFLIVENYTIDFTLLSQQYISVELPKFGGFYSGEKYNFFVFGQDNKSENNSNEVLRIVRYTKDWTRLDSAVICGANTSIPFGGGGLRMTECGDYLYIRTCHVMYADESGTNHQANMTFEINETNMTVTDSNYAYSNITSGYVSHSFNQFILVDDSNNLVALDHGDGSPRSVVLYKYNKAAGSSTFGGSSQGNGTAVNVLPIQGMTGDNYTGVSLGGLEYSSTAYLAAGNSSAQDETWSEDPTRNVFISVTSRSSFSAGGSEIKWITNYSYGDYDYISTPQLVKISADKFLLMWTLDQTALNYVYLDGSGNKISEIYTAYSGMSDCQPIAVDGNILWYCSGQYTYYGEVIQSEPILRKIDKDGNFSYYKAS